MPAHLVFFPAAALYAALLVPLRLTSHAHEMLFGFALAAVAGNQLGPLPRWKLALLFGAWVAARFWPPANAVFAVLLALQVLPRLLAPIRKWRNRALPLAVIALCIAAVLADLHAAVVLLAFLMLFMGGRILAPYAAVRVQPRLEGVLVVVMSLALFTLTGPLLMVAGIVAAVRLFRWRLWRLRRRPDVACLAIGYAWVAAGLVAVGAALVAGVRPVTAMHLVTVGGMGTLTINVMALTYARLARIDPATQRLPVVATALVAAATVARVTDLLVPAAALWSAAYALALLAFVQVSRAAASRRAASR